MDNITPELSSILEVIIDMIIPSSEKFQKPSGQEVEFDKYIIEKKLVHWLQEGLEKVEEASKDQKEKKFSQLNRKDQEELILIMRKKNRRFFNDLAKYLFQCYYQDPKVQKSIGLSGAPPFPHGQLVKETDLSSLEEVYERGKVFRD